MTEHFNGVNENTPEHYDKIFSLGRMFRDWPYKLAISLLPKKYIPKSILDVGCASGGGSCLL